MKRINLLVLILSLFVISQTTVSAQVAKNRKLPEGKWTFSATPYSGKDWRSIPVDVKSVTSNMLLGGLIERVELQNWSKNSVTGVKLRWILSVDGREISTGDTTTLTTSILSGQTAELNNHIVEFSRIVRTFTKDGRLEGNFRIEVVATRIEFEDGATWKTGDPGIIPGLTGLMIANGGEGGGGCANQKCLWSPPPISTYVCDVDPGTFCSVTQQGQSCTVTRCTPGGDRPGGFFF